MWLNLAIMILTFLFMEFVAWFTHKYIMHGFLWTWHKSHHSIRKGIFERNDLFAIVFSIPAVILIITGSYYGIDPLMYIGFGITAYGIFYVVFHDIIVHRRVNIKYKATSDYMKRIINAHYIHHRTHTKEGAEAFGFLYAPRKYASKK